MTLVLRAVTLNEEPISKPLIGRFDERGGTVGRSDEATLTLPDAERMISRVQAQVIHQDNKYWLENLSAVTPILHNGRALSTGMRVVLQEGDEIRIVGYVLEAGFEDDPESATLLRGRTVIPRVQSPPPVPKPAPAPAPAARTPAPSMPAPSPPPRAAPDFSATGSMPASAFVPTQSPGVAGSGNVLWKHLLDGAQVELNLPQGPTPDLLHTIGEMLNITVGGLLRLISMRASVKNEMQARMTSIQVRDNNPLKFSPDATLALQTMLQPQARGFLNGPEALRDAFTDLQAHQIGMAAGRRSVVDALLERVDPSKLESQSAARSLLEKLMPARRRARLWDQYVKEFAALREEALDGSQRFIADSLRKAYEAQVSNLATSYERSEPDAAGRDDERTPPARPRR
jgi:predicted component of type VI protein secretion system